MDRAPEAPPRRLLLLPDAVFDEGSLRRGVGVLVEGDDVVAVDVPAGLAARASETVALAGRILVAGTVNVHNHSFQSLLRGIGDDLPFLEWRQKVLYHWAPRLGPDGVEAGALLAFGEMLLAGVTTACDFFYLHDGGNDNARRVLRAARRLGIRLVMARCFYDWDGAPAAFRESPDEAEARFEELSAESAGDAAVLVCPAPHSLHGASEAMIRRGAEAARRHGVPMHIHIAEEQFQVDHARTQYGQTPLRALDAMGALGEDTVIVNGCWLDEGERALLGERRGRLAHCPGSNMFLGQGVTDVVDLGRRGVRIGLGTDGGCSNNRVSVYDEMRTCALLQKVHRLDGQAIDAQTCYRMGTVGGGEVLGLPVGRVAAGFRADLVTLDAGDLSLQPGGDLGKNLVYALSPHAIRDVFVGGRRVVHEGRLATVPVEEIRARVARVFAAA